VEDNRPTVWQNPWFAVLPDMRNSLARKTPKGANQVNSKDSKNSAGRILLRSKKSAMFALTYITILNMLK
jgi:hypothetical protein